MKKLKFLSLFLVLLIFFGFLASNVQAQGVADVEARRAQLQAELEQQEREIAEQTKLLQAKQRDTATVAGELNLLKSQIAQSQTAIKAKKVAITGLENDIRARTKKIETLAARIKREQLSLGELLRQVRDIDELSFVEVILDGNNLTSVFRDVDNASSIQEALAQSFVEIRSAQDQAKIEQAQLEKKKDAELDAQKVIEEQKKIVEKKEADKTVLLNISKNQEKAYQTILAERQKKAAQIRAALFGLRDSAAIPFGQALDFATAAAKKTGVRPALILAILQQESNLGENVGSCVITNLETGETRSVKTGTLFPRGIHPTRDLPVLQSLLSGLGRNPFLTNVSCPQSIGYGGAMGPAQFIPSTWNYLKVSIAAAVGRPVPDPWNPEDAFMAAAILLKDNGAGSKNYTNERTAACKYYSGQNCYKKNGAPNVGLSYGNQVMTKASDIQLNMIDPLQSN